jgi:ABC-type antimicrobial peptide transport system permease subunit
MILFQGMRLVFIGPALGWGIGWLASPAMEALFFHATPGDRVVFGATAAVLALTGVLASLLPALRAASTDPVVALREGS